MSNQATTFVRCATANMRVMFVHNVDVGTLVGEGQVIRYSQAVQETLTNGDTVELTLVVLDADIDPVPEYILAIGDGEPEPVYRFYVQTQFSKHPSTVDMDGLQLPSLKIYISELDFKKMRQQADECSGSLEQPRQRQQSVRESAKASAKTVIDKHLDDIIAQAQLLKETDDPLVQGDAHARMNFAMSSITRLKMGNYGEDPFHASFMKEIRSIYGSPTRSHDASRNSRDVRRGPDVIYRTNTDSYYTPEGEFIETNDEATARAWYGDASPESMERLRRERDRAERERGEARREDESARDTDRHARAENREKRRAIREDRWNDRRGDERGGYNRR